MEDTPHLVSEKQLEQLKAEHPEAYLHVLTAETEDQVVVRRPSRMEWKRFQGQIGNPARRETAHEMLVRAVLIFPGKDEFDALLERRPGLVETFGLGVIEVAGMSNKVEKKAV